MASTEAVQSTVQPEKVGAIDAAAEGSEEVSPGRISKRPFVLKNTPGPRGGHLATMLIIAGTLGVLAIAMVALFSTTGKSRKRTMEETGKPNLGQSHTGTTSGDLVPNNKVKPTPNGASESGAVNASDIERTKSPHLVQSQPLGSSAQSPKSLGEIGKFAEPDTLRLTEVIPRRISRRRKRPRTRSASLPLSLLRMSNQVLVQDRKASQWGRTISVLRLAIAWRRA